LRFHPEDFFFMAGSYKSAVSPLKRKSLAACIAVLFSANAMASPADNGVIEWPSYDKAPQTTAKIRTVTNCDDAGPGSLRDTIFNAMTGDLIDLTQLACSEITLYTGKIAVSSADLTLLGPGLGPEASSHLTINGYDDRIFTQGTGTLTISGLVMQGGHYPGNFARGGCIFSSGTLVIQDSIVSGCEVDLAYGSNAFAAGGAIYVQGDLWLQNSIVTDSVAYSPTQRAYGGGVFAAYNVTIIQSTISDNEATAPQAYSMGGGLKVIGFGNVKILRSTISGNEAELGGGMHVDTLGLSQIVDSTLSDNYASMYAGAAFFTNGPVRVTSSTITRNSAYAYTPGIASDFHPPMANPIVVQNSIVADNRAVATPVAYDLSAQSIGGGSSLIMSANVSTPSDTITVCPRLAALGYNGGETPTHALLPGSPGIDVGDGAGLTVDQRGGGYPRVVGTSSDIGAYEWQGDFGDDLFRSAFEIECDRYD
jgi:parallel beta helix pectate lyase-like protein